ncbi:MAG: hypothetical protein JWN34_3053 [Bryobacterales bacterium]|nr:hypothetical protein [Bryobacterales bacterium]
MTDMPLATELAALFRRDLVRLTQEVESFPENLLWETRPGIANSAGNLVLHLEGNLRHFIGHVLGGVTYTRQRDLEFSTRGLSRDAVLTRIRPLADLIAGVVAVLTDEVLDGIYPETVLGGSVPTRQLVLSLYGHLSYHMGQIDYLRRVLSGNGAIDLAGL